MCIFYASAREGDVTQVTTLRSSVKNFTEPRERVSEFSDRADGERRSSQDPQGPLPILYIALARSAAGFGGCSAILAATR
jgi:hypothetical protein